MTDLDILNELLKASPAVRRAMKAYLHKAFQRGQRYGERTAREMFDELLHRVHTVSHLNGATEIFKAQWEEAKHPRGQPENAGEFAPADGGVATEHRADSNQSPLSSIPETREDAEDIAFDLRDEVIGPEEDAIATSGDCITATALLRRKNPEAEIWRGIYPGDWEEGGEHRISKIGDWFIDVTADQFDGPDVVVFSQEDFEEAQLGAGKYWKYGGFERYKTAEQTTDELNKKTARKAFDESKHPRDHGQFSSAPGSDSAGDKPVSPNRIEHPTDKHARTLAERIRSVPKRIRVKVAHLVRKKYEGLVEKFGKNGARAIIGASLFMLPVPLPGASMIPIALAHAVLKIRNLVSGPSLALVKAVGPEPTRDELERAAREFIEGIYRDMGEEPPEIPEELDLDDAGEPEAEEIDLPESSSGASDESPDSDSRMTESGVTESDGDVSDAVALALIEHAIDAKENGVDPEPGLRAILEAATRHETGTIHKAQWEEAKHPRGDDGQFIDKDEIAKARSDPDKAAELRKKVTKPEERKKLDKQIEEASDTSAEVRNLLGYEDEESKTTGTAHGPANRVHYGEGEPPPREERARASGHLYQLRKEGIEITKRIVAAHREGKVETIKAKDVRTLAQAIPFMSMDELRGARNALRYDLAHGKADQTKRDLVPKLVAFAKQAAENIEQREKPAEPPAPEAKPLVMPSAAHETTAPADSDAPLTAAQIHANLRAALERRGAK